MSETDAIELKKQQKNEDNNDDNDDTKKESNWKTFGWSCLSGVFLAIITWLIASNIVFFVRLPQKDLNDIFPKDPSAPPYAPDKDYEQTEKCSAKAPDIDGENLWEAAKNIKPIVAGKADAPANPLLGAASTAANLATEAAEKSPQAKIAEAALGASGVPGAPAIPGTQDGGGLKDEIMNRVKSTTSKYSFPYKWMYPYSDCRPEEKDTITNFYVGDDSNNVYDRTGKLSGKNDPEKYYTDWKTHKETMIKAIDKKIIAQNIEITNGSGENKAENLGDMEENLKKMKKIKATIEPPFYKGAWWVQFGRNLKNWISTSTQYSFITERRIMQFIFKKSKVIFGEQDVSSMSDLALQDENSYLFGLVGIIVNMILASFIIHIALTAGTVLNVWGQVSGTKYTDYSIDKGYTKESHWGRGIKYSIIMGCFGMINFMWSFGVGCIQYIEIIYKFLMYPLINNFSDWKENVSITAKYLPIIYGMLITLAAWANLEPLYGNVMFITLLIYIIKNNKSMNAEIKKAKRDL
jgi:hypothetical protein